PLLRLLAVVLLVAGCDDLNRLPDATEENAVDTVTIGALTGTPLSVPSAYSVAERRVVRTEQSAAFDFVYDTVEGAPRFYPPASIGLGGSGTQAGLLSSTTAFEDIDRAPQNGYETEEPVPATVGAVYAVRSRLVCGSVGGVPMYGKLEVLELDPVAATVTFQILTNNNCGYRSLEPGVPEE
ncbi:MAG: hypothetical protein M3Y31_06440, partial [Gemmatimonadota bacterium]|nr:hypothetical protein [Gemmatimonadota bacterium]